VKKLKPLKKINTVSEKLRNPQYCHSTQTSVITGDTFFSRTWSPGPRPQILP